MKKSASQFQLLGQRRFGFFCLTQFFGAFNDNVFKNALLIMITYQIAASAEQVNNLVNVAAALFILPFFLFSATAGQLADKYEKSNLMRKLKILEIVIMSCAAIGFYFQNVPLLMTLLFLMGTQSSLFGPVKYGILPQHLNVDELVGGNAMVETFTFLAILVGTIAGAQLVSIEGWGPRVVAGGVVLFAVMGYLASRGIPTATAVAPNLEINWNPISETWRNFRFTRRNRTVFLSILGISWFWFLGATYLTQMLNFTREILMANEHVATLLLTLFSVGIGFGSLLCERLSGHKVEIGLVPLGSIGLSVFGIDLYLAAPHSDAEQLQGVIAFLAQPGAVRVCVDIVAIGLFGGFYIVPLYALVLERSEPSHRSRIIAGNNILNALFMVLAAALALTVLNAGLNIPELFLLLALLNIVVAVYIYNLVPEFTMRFLVWLLTHTIYRVEKQGLEHIPEQGACILVCNHVSFVDALIIAASIRRPVRFVMYYKIFHIPLLSFIFRTARTIPIAGAREDPVMLQQAYDEVSEALNQGDIVVVFPEGRLTADGEIGPFKPGVFKMLQRNPVPVIPMALSGLWGSLFSRKDGALLQRRPRKLFARIKLCIGQAIAVDALNAEKLQQRVAQLRSAP